MLQIIPIRSSPLRTLSNRQACFDPPPGQGPGQGPSPIPTTKSPYRVDIIPVPVLTTSVSSKIVQVPPPLTGTKPDTTGTLVSSLETGGRPSTAPLLTSSIPTPKSSLLPQGTVLDSLRPAPMSTEQPLSANIFADPIATTAPAPMFPVKKDHPVPRVGINGPAPIATNKFYASFYLGKQTSPAYVHPYTVAWARGQGASSSWGLSISHVEANQRVYGQVRQETGAARYFLNPIGIQSLCLSAAELGDETQLTTDNLAAQSINVNLHPNTQAKPLITFPLVQGMGFVTGVYHGGTPVINTGIFFKTVTKSTKGPKPGITKYTFYLEDGKVWYVYSHAESGDNLDLKVINNGLAKSDKPFTGFIQVTKDPGSFETTIDMAAGTYPIGVTLSGTVSEAKGSYTFGFKKGGDESTKLMMYALPHQVNSFDKATRDGLKDLKLQTTTKGMAMAVMADSWTMVEPNMAIAMDFSPWDPVGGPKKSLSDEAIRAISPVALKEMSQSADQQANQNSMYFGGKVQLLTTLRVPST